MATVDIDHPLLFWIHRLSRSILRASMAYYQHEFGLGVPQVQVLHALIRGPLASKEIADVLAMNKTLISRSVRELEDLGYVTSTMDSDDGRLRIWSLTGQGQRFVDMARPIRMERQRKFLSVLTNEEQLLLGDVLNKLYASSEELRANEAEAIIDASRTRDVHVDLPPADTETGSFDPAP